MDNTANSVKGDFGVGRVGQVGRVGGRRGRPRTAVAGRVPGLPESEYNADLGHCMGNGSDCCHGCLRRLMYCRWLRLPEDKVESVVMLPARASALGCRNMLDRRWANI